MENDKIRIALDWLNENLDKYEWRAGEFKLLIPESEIPVEVLEYIQGSKQTEDLLADRILLAKKAGLIN